MPKLGMQPIRQRQLIDATLAAINEVGMHDATVAQIARRAGVSTGIISHYFKDKNGLLEATMRDITGQLRQAVLSRLHALPGAGPRGMCSSLAFGRRRAGRRLLHAQYAGAVQKDLRRPVDPHQDRRQRAGRAVG